MSEVKLVRIPLANNFSLSKDQCIETNKDKDFMAKAPYVSAIRSLMYAKICTRPDITHAVGTVSRFMSNPGKHHWKQLRRYLDTCEVL